MASVMQSVGRERKAVEVVVELVVELVVDAWNDEVTYDGET